MAYISNLAELPSKWVHRSASNRIDELMDDFDVDGCLYHGKGVGALWVCSVSQAVDGKGGVTIQAGKGLIVVEVADTKTGPIFLVIRDAVDEELQRIVLDQQGFAVDSIDRKGVAHGLSASGQDDGARKHSANKVFNLGLVVRIRGR